MPSIENSLKFESEVPSGTVRLVASEEFLRAYNHSAWLFYCCISKYKPYRTYPATRTLRRMRGRMKTLDWSEGPRRVQARVNSMLGVLSHYDCWHVRKTIVYEARLRRSGRVTDDCHRFDPDALARSISSQNRCNAFWKANP